MPPMIFIHLHLQKTIPKQEAPKITIPFNYFLDRHDFVSTSLANRHNLSLVYYSVCSNGCVVRFVINSDVPHKSSAFIFEKAIMSPNSSVTISPNNCVVIIDTTTGTFFSVSDKTLRETSIDLCSRTVYAAGDFDEVIYTSSDGTLDYGRRKRRRRKLIRKMVFRRSEMMCFKTT